MFGVVVPENMKRVWPDSIVRVISPPDGDILNDKIRACDALIHYDEEMEAPIFRMYYKPDAEDIAEINQGALIEVHILGSTIPPHGVMVRNPDVEYFVEKK